MDDRRRRLFWHGLLLFLLGLVTGLFVQQLRNPRMGLAAHLEGLMNGTFLLALGAAWQEARLSRRTATVAFGAALFGTYANWATTTIAAILGTGAMTPIASGVHKGRAWQELLVTVGFTAVGLAMLVSCALLLWGFRNARRAASTTMVLLLASMATPALAQTADRPGVAVGDQWHFAVYYAVPSATPNRAWVVTSVTPERIEGTENGEPLRLTPALNVIESPLQKSSNHEALRFPLEVGTRWRYRNEWVFKPKGSNGTSPRGHVTDQQPVRRRDHHDVLVRAGRARNREVGPPQSLPGHVDGRSGRVHATTVT